MSTSVSDRTAVPTVWDRWLTAVIVAVMAYAGVLVTAGGIAGRMFGLLGFGMTDAGVTSADARRYVLLVYGVLGAAMLGWSALLLAVVRLPLRRRESWAWLAVTASVACWFALDTALSLATRFPTHALFNIAFVAAVAPPLAALRSRCTATSGAPTRGRFERSR